MLGTRLVLFALGAWFVIAPIVAIVVGRALRAADPHAGYELATRRATPATHRVAAVPLPLSRPPAVLG
jgi:hypothetical protein